jgi:hypothetical protein
VPQQALYYPTWAIADPRFLFESLLYWERLVCIAPYSGFQPRVHIRGELGPPVDALHERFVSGMAPTDEQRELVHAQVEELLGRPAPTWCRPERLDAGRLAGVATEKLGHKTAELLISRGWGRPGADSMIEMWDAAAGVVMNEFVEVMSSEQMRPVTSDARRFRALCNTFLWQLDAPKGLAEGSGGVPDALGDDDAAFVLARISRLALGDRPVTAKDLNRLLRLREDGGFEEVRARYCSKVDEYLVELQQARNSEERGVVHDTWRERLRSDRKALKRELRDAHIEALVEKDGLVATVVSVVAGSAAFAAAGPVGVAIGLALAGAGIARNIRARRREAFAQHWTSWLFAAQPPRLGPVN